LRQPAANCHQAATSAERSPAVNPGSTYQAEAAASPGAGCRASLLASLGRQFGTSAIGGRFVGATPVAEPRRGMSAAAGM